jgi:hypothetical protein
MYNAIIEDVHMCGRASPGEHRFVCLVAANDRRRE